VIKKIKGIPVDLNRAPVKAPAPMLPRVSCFPRMASIDELIPLYKRAKVMKIYIRVDDWK
jgi:hypothetical protein